MDAGQSNELLDVLEKIERRLDQLAVEARAMHGSLHRIDKSLEKLAQCVDDADAYGPLLRGTDVHGPTP